MTNDEIRLANEEARPRWLRAETLSAGLLTIVLFTGLQRMVGLVRNVLFCELLADDQLGRWSLSYNFLLLAAPLVVLGLPGSFGRYVEHYRQRGQLHSFLWRVTGLSVLLVLVSVVVLFSAPQWLAWLIYDDPSRIVHVRLLAVTLISVVAFNYLVELLTALRVVRVAAVMQLVASIAFAGVAVILIRGPWAAEAGVVIAYGIAMALAACIGLWGMISLYRTLPAGNTHLDHVDLCRKLLPFAGWIWVGNLVANLFAVADQFMLKHFSTLSTEVADSLVGQYYCSRVIPVLLIGLAGLVAGMTLPHWTRDWESGARRQVADQIRLAMKLTAAAFTIIAALTLMGAPLIFEWILGGKYNMGMAVLPGTFVYCIWFSLFMVVDNYLLCAERARWGSLALVVGLLANVVLNGLLVPRYGLPGVVTATVTANGITMLLIMTACSRAGMKWDGHSCVALLMPLCLVAGGVITLISLGLAICLGWFFNPKETETLTSWCEAIWQRVVTTRIGGAVFGRGEVS